MVGRVVVGAAVVGRVVVGAAVVGRVVVGAAVVGRAVVGAPVVFLVAAVDAVAAVTLELVVGVVVDDGLASTVDRVVGPAVDGGRAVNVVGDVGVDGAVGFGRAVVVAVLRSGDFELEFVVSEPSGAVESSVKANIPGLFISSVNRLGQLLFGRLDAVFEFDLVATHRGTRAGQ